MPVTILEKMGCPILEPLHLAVMELGFPDPTPSETVNVISFNTEISLF